MSKPRKIDVVLSSEHRQQFEQLALNPSMPLDQLVWWLKTHDYKVGRSSVARWRRSFKAMAADPIHRLRTHLHEWIEIMSADQLQAVFDQLSAQFGAPPPHREVGRC